MNKYEIKPAQDSRHSFFRVFCDGVICYQSESDQDCLSYVADKQKTPHKLLSGLSVDKIEQLQSDFYDCNFDLMYKWFQDAVGCFNDEHSAYVDFRTMIEIYFSRGSAINHAKSLFNHFKSL